MSFLTPIVDLIFEVFDLLLLARVLLSWINVDPYNPVVRFLYNVTEPVLYRVRRTIPFSYAGGIDFSPLIVILGLYFLQIFLVRSLQDFALAMR